ncbi:MAG: MATE family efflux transporter [Actinomycetota bacterium]|nr:MATE family efflux transporter [Actinomycetota bacterium]
MTAVPDRSAAVRRLLALSASAFLVLAAEPLYLLVDTAVVGHLGATALGGLGVGAALMGLLTTVGTFVEYGTTGRAARWHGAGRTQDAVNEGVQASWIALCVGILAAVLGEVFAGPLTHLLGGDGSVQRAAEGWFRIAVIGLPGVLLVLAGNGWMRGVQRTREPVMIVVAANVLSAIGSPVLVYGFGLGLNGSAIANVAAQALGAAFFLRALHRVSARWRPDRAVIWAQSRVGRDLVIRAAAFQAAFLSAAGVAARMGTVEIAAHQIGLQLWEFTALLLDSFAIAAQSLVGAALGGEDAETARTTTWLVARWGSYAGVGFGALYGALWLLLPKVFTSSPAVQHQTHLLWPWFVAMLPAAGLVFALDGVLIGAGDVGYLRTITVVAALVGFVPLNLAALHWHWGIGGVWAGLTAFVLIRMIGMLVRVHGGRWLVLGVRS